MLFTEPVFLFLFLPLTLAMYFACGPRLANGVLVAAGFVFYAFDEQAFAAGLAGCVVFNYLIGLGMRRVRGGPWERPALWAGVAGNIGLLVAFKYSHFILVNLYALLRHVGFSFSTPVAAPLPLGISFFTFHAVTYIVDVHKRTSEPQKNPLSLALYITLFPQLAAGPITEFWRRWHITLSTWFRDYVYIPLGGNRRGIARTYFNLIAVFALCGLWHGPEWKLFMAWGLFHGAFLILERAGFSRVLTSGSRAASHIYTLLVIIIGWVFFRADTLGHALLFIKAMAGFAPGNAGPFHAPLYFSNDFIAALIAACVFSMPAAPAIETRLRGRLGAAARFPAPLFFTTPS